MTAATLRLTRPLLAFDLETTGLSVRDDRIVELGWVVLSPEGGRSSGVWRLNPGRPICARATAVHGIGDADVQDCPSFAQLAPQIAERFGGCDLAGYNVEKFDLPLLSAEFQRVGLAFPDPGAAVLDACTIFMRRHPRHLAAALSHYCDRPLEQAHSAGCDAAAALDVLLAQVGRYADVEPTVAGWDHYCRPQRAARLDRLGKLVWQPQGAALSFGRHRHRPLAELARDERGYLQWLLEQDFPDDTKAIVREALAGRLPQPPPAPGRPPGAAG